MGREVGCWAGRLADAELSNEVMDGWADEADEADDEWEDEERAAKVSGGGRLDSASVSFGSGDSVGRAALRLAGTPPLWFMLGTVPGRRSGDEDGEGGVVDIDAVGPPSSPSLRFFVLGTGTGAGAACFSSSSSLQSHATLVSRLTGSPPSADTCSSSLAI